MFHSWKSPCQLKETERDRASRQHTDSCFCAANKLCPSPVLSSEMQILSSLYSSFCFGDVLSEERKTRHRIQDKVNCIEYSQRLYAEVVEITNRSFPYICVVSLLFFINRVTVKPGQCHGRPVALQLQESGQREELSPDLSHNYSQHC